MHYTEDAPYKEFKDRELEHDRFVGIRTLIELSDSYDPEVVASTIQRLWKFDSGITKLCLDFNMDEVAETEGAKRYQRFLQDVAKKIFGESTLTRAWEKAFSLLLKRVTM